MRRSLFVLTLLSTSACGLGGGDAWRIDNDRSCDADVVALSRDLTTHLVLGGDGTGAFDYAPEGATFDNHSGFYDPVTGDFSWESTGSADSWIELVEVTDAYGYANENGDLDVVGSLALTDVLGVVEESQFRIERVGCDSEIRTRYNVDALTEQEQVETGSYTADAYTYSRVTDIDGVAYTVEGTRLADGSYTHALAYEATDYTYEADVVGDVDDRTSTTDFVQRYPGQNVTRDGTETRRSDGSSTRSFLQSAPNGNTQWDYTLDYEGNGSGTVSGQGFECDLTFTAGSCRYDCGRGNTGNC